MKKFISLLSIISLLLSAALISGILISCGSNSPANMENTDNNISADNQDGEQSGDENKTDARIEPELPEMDFGGYAFTFLAHLYDGDDWVSTVPLEILAEEEMGEPVNDAVFKRNLKIKEKYNIDIKMVAVSDESGTMKKAVAAGDDVYDAAVMFNNNIPGIVTAGVLTNIANLPYIDLSKPWWDPAANSMSIDNKNYLLAGDLLILDNEATNAMLFNKDLIADLGLEMPYKLAGEGKWTMDRLNEYIKGAAADLNGDGKITPEDDRWGLIAFNDTLHAFLVAGGGALAVKDENDLPQIDFTSQRNLAVIEKSMDIMYNADDVLNVQSRTASADWSKIFYGAFEENRALFMWIRMRVVEKYRGMEANFGIIPMPKFDEAQENYCSVVNPYTGVMLGVPKSASEFERISIILEALAAESKYTLQPAYYDIVLQRKYARDEESSEMLDIIFNSRVYDIGSVYSFGNVFLDFIALCNRSDRNIASYYDKNIGKMERAIDKVVDTLESMD